MSTNTENAVTVTDINMPFWSMVSFMVKFAIASIPAFIILMVFFMVFAAMFGIGASLTP